MYSSNNVEMAMQGTSICIFLAFGVFMVLLMASMLIYGIVENIKKQRKNIKER